MLQNSSFDVREYRRPYDYNTQNRQILIYRGNNMNDNKKNNKKASFDLSIGMCIGLAIGTAIGAATHNIGLWMPIGLGAGTCLGLVLGHNRENDNEDDTENKQ